MLGSIGGGIQTSWSSNGRGLANATNFVLGTSRGAFWTLFFIGGAASVGDCDVPASSLVLETQGTVLIIDLSLITGALPLSLGEVGGSDFVWGGGATSVPLMRQCFGSQNVDSPSL